MTAGSIQIRGARQNNLAGIDLTIPQQRVVAITGVSGSGKSSLAFDTLYREGERRFLETLSAYARQFLGRMEKPDVDHIEGLSPAIAVDQSSLYRGPRSTVGTITEIVDHLRVLFARAGTAHCPEHGTPIAGTTQEAIVQQVLERFGEENLSVLAPLVRDRKGEHRALFEELTKKGFVRVRVDGEVLRIEDVPALARYVRHEIELVIDRLKGGRASLARLREAIGQAIEHGRGDVVVVGARGEHSFSTLRACPTCGVEAPPLEPRLFSFNSPHGACRACEGLGVRMRASAALVVADPERSIRSGALSVTKKSGGGLLFPHVDFAFLERVAESHGFDLDTPWKELSLPARRSVLHGTGDEEYAAQLSWNGAKHQGSVSWKRRFKGVLPAVEKAAKSGAHKQIAQRFLAVETCPDCGGSRLSRFARAVRAGGATIDHLVGLSVEALARALAELVLTGRERTIAAPLLAEIARRLAFLEEVGLSYLTLDRAADSLSSGEAQRIRLAAQLGAGLSGVLYVLDEPSIGLHARDHGRLFRALERLRDAGNSVIVVEHDEATLRAADWLVDIGPGPGRHGGRVVASGPPAEVAMADSPTGRWLRGELEPAPRATRRAGNGKQLAIRGARGFNLKGVDVSIELGTLTVVSGVSGSGKSTLVHGTLGRALARKLGREGAPAAPHDSIRGLEHVEDFVLVDAAPIGRTPRSNPATYTGAFTPIRDLFAALPEARMHGWEPGRFSFNVAGGRCEACQGGGATIVELQFLAPVTVACSECGGRRFQHETLAARFKEKSIADVLASTVEEALELFRDVPKIARPLAALAEVGLSYLALGQPSTTLSGGEAQRVKLATYLQKRTRKHTLYVLDEPTTGLHALDVQCLLAALQSLVEQGHSVLVIEHNLDVVRAADRVIDLGPEGGAAGGCVVAVGTPEEIEAHPSSYTGEALRASRGARLAGLAKKPGAQPIGMPTFISVHGARTNNLKNVSVRMPRRGLTVITGPSGSGKSSLALDTIHALGRQRFVESLSTYARQFLASRDRPPVDRIEGLGPSIAVEARTSIGHPRSTVATTTEIHDHLRVLFSRGGTRRCPTHAEALVATDAGGLAKRILSASSGGRGWIAAPMFGPGAEEPADLPAAFRAAAGAWRKGGFVRVLVDGAERRLDSLPELPSGAATVDLVIDRLVLEANARGRIAEAVSEAEGLGGGRVAVLARDADGSLRRSMFSSRGACTQCGFALAEELEPRHFSFNTHAGACPECDGLGERWTADAERIVDRAELPLVSDEGGETAVSGKLGRYLTKGKGYYEFLLRTVARAHRIDLGRPFEALPTSARELLLHGIGARASYRVEIDKESGSFELHESFSSPWPGLCGHVDAWHRKSEDPEWRAILERHMHRARCRACDGERLAAAPRAVTIGRKRMPEVLALSVSEAHAWLSGLELGSREQGAVAPVLEELCARVGLLERVGLGYLTLDRTTSTLSSGEARRVRLSAALGSELVGVCYVLDEPTVGLHPRDVDRLVDALLVLRDGGNSVIVVEHDETVMGRADWIIDMGPGAGRLGGEVVVSGTVQEVMGHPTSLTGMALRGEIQLARVERRGRASGEALSVHGARVNNLRGVDFEARFGEITGVCGASGSGKSSLVLDCFVPAISGEAPAGRWRSARGASRAARVVVVDADPIGRTPASVPATAVGLLEPLRELFARTPEARVRGFSASHFSFNSTKGRCPACEGRGAIQVEMQFLADLWLTCEECDGRRYRPEILEAKWRGKHIADVLALTVEEAAAFLADVPVAARILAALDAVGLSYLMLDQSSTTLSSGEAQRVKLASELLFAESAARSVVVLDEPTTGLSKSDVARLFRALDALCARGDAVVVVEHHVDLLAACDRLVELGPEGGAGGGRVVAAGTPRELAADRGSATGPFLARALERMQVSAPPESRPRAKAQGRIAL